MRRYHLIFIKTAAAKRKKKPEITIVGKDVAILGHLCVAGELVNEATTVENVIVIFLKELNMSFHITQ